MRFFQFSLRHGLLHIQLPSTKVGGTNLFITNSPNRLKKMNRMSHLLNRLVHKLNTTGLEMVLTKYSALNQTLKYSEYYRQILRLHLALTMR